MAFLKTRSGVVKNRPDQDQAVSPVPRPVVAAASAERANSEFRCEMKRVSKIRATDKFASSSIKPAEADPEPRKPLPRPENVHLSEDSGYLSPAEATPGTSGIVDS